MAETVQPRSYGVDEITYYVKEYLAEDSFLSSLAVRGEASGVRLHKSGHLYLTLKGASSSLPLVMFRRWASQVKVLPQEGQMVVAVGSISLYERDSAVQLYAELLFPETEDKGAAARAREELKLRLQEEGLFAEERKRPLPPYALRVGAITAPDSAAWADISRIIRQRMPAAQLTLYPALVQGDQAPASLAQAIAQADRGGEEVLLLARGGGAEADLAAFDSEQVVRAVAACSTPLICAVGHESDFSLADLAADLRAATPTHGASLAVADEGEVRERILRWQQRLWSAARWQLDMAEERLDRARDSVALRQPARLLREAGDRLSRWREALDRAAQLAEGAKEQQLLAQCQRLRLLDPLAVLGRGYALARREDGSLLRAATEIQVGDQFRLQLAQGSLAAQVIHKEEE